MVQVVIPALNGLPFQPNKLCRTLEEAKNYAAEYVLQQITVPTDGSGNVGKSTYNSKKILALSISTLDL